MHLSPIGYPSLVYLVTVSLIYLCNFSISGKPALKFYFHFEFPFTIVGGRFQGVVLAYINSAT